MTEEQISTYEARQRRGIPLLDALIEGTEAVNEGEEIALHYAIMRQCRRRGWTYVYHDPTRRTGATLGTPDFIIIAGRGVTLWVECKTRKGKLSKDQENFKRDLEGRSHAYFLIRSEAQFCAEVNKYLPPDKCRDLTKP